MLGILIFQGYGLCQCLGHAVGKQAGNKFRIFRNCQGGFQENKIKHIRLISGRFFFVNR